MAQVPDKVLSWLYSVLHEYHDAQRTYSDVVRTISTYPSLSPRTEVYTYENGSSALLLTLSGTLPVQFRGNAYRFPVKLWVPHGYPQDVPMVYVIPGRDMLVRPGQHVSVDGRVYHPYLKDWSGMWDRASIAEFIGFLQQVFAKEPPVISKQQQQQYQTRPLSGQAGAPPRPPPKQIPGSEQPAELAGAKFPPPRPPKPGEEYANSVQQRPASRDISRDGPPLPPLPSERLQSQHYTSPQSYPNGYAVPPRASSQAQPPPQRHQYQNGRPPGPPLPPLPPQQTSHGYRSNHDRSPVSPISPPVGYAELPETRYRQAPPLPEPQLPQVRPHAQPAPPYALQQPQYGQSYQRSPPHTHPPHGHFAPQPFQQKPQPPPDLLSDPFDIALPAMQADGPTVPAPPIPPNPEKEQLLHALSGTLSQQVQQQVQRNLAAITPLQAQQSALRDAHSRLEAEIRHLEALDKQLASNESILHRSIQDCDTTIRRAKSRQQPPIDEVLIAPTMVANQLWGLCAEEAAAREAMYVLQRAVGEGRVSGADFVKQTRSLAREVFLKMALARKCARGLGLELGRS